MIFFDVLRRFRRKFFDLNENFIFAVGALAASTVLNIYFHLLFDQDYTPVLLFACFGYLSVRYYDLFYKILTSLGISSPLSFALVALSYILCLVFMGTLGVSVPASYIPWIVIIDILILTLSFTTQALYPLLIGFLLGLCLILQNSSFGEFFNVQGLWTAFLGDFGFISIDTYRDASTLNAWNEFSIITHGTHGLLFTPYHSLFAQIINPFMPWVSNNALLGLQNFSHLIFFPLFIFNIGHVIDSLITKRINKYWFFVLFLFSYGCTRYCISIRSLQSAALISFGVLPLIYQAWKDRLCSAVGLALLSITAPLMIYARVFHGLIFLGVYTPLVLNRNKWFKSLIVLLGPILGLTVLFLLFGPSERNNGLHLKSLLIALDPCFQNQLFPVGLLFLFFLFIFYKIRPKPLNWFSIFYGKNQTDRLWLLGVISLGSFLLASLKSVSVPDVWFTSILYGWIVIFLLFSKDYYPSFLEGIKSTLKFIASFFEIDYKIELKFLNWKKIKTLNYWIIPIFLLFSVSRYNRSVNGLLKSDLSKITQFKSENNSKCIKEDRFCKIRKRLSQGVADIEKAKDQSQLAKIVNIVKSQKPRKFSVFIPLNHFYWEEFSLLRVSGVFLMATTARPLLYGLHPLVNNKGFGYPYIIKQKGQLSENLGSDHTRLCQEALRVGTPEVLIFKENSLVYSFLKCEV